MTAALLASSLDLVSLLDLLASKKPIGSRTPLPSPWNDFRSQAEALVAVVFNWKLIVFGALTTVAAAIAGISTWKAIQLARELPKSSAAAATEKAAVAEAGAPSRIGRQLLGASLAFRIARSLATLLAVVGLLVIGAVSYRVSEAIEAQVTGRALITARTLADVAAPQIAAKDRLALSALVGRYGIGNEVAYIVIADPNGDILAHNLAETPQEFARVMPVFPSPQSAVDFRGESVIESRAMIGGGQLGILYYGVRRSAVTRAIRSTLWPIIALVLALFAAGILLAALLARRIARPIVALKAGADRISRGEFDEPVGVQSADEIGDLAQSLERIRSSLHAAMVRLNRQLRGSAEREP